jgi:hypothetical protein
MEGSRLDPDEITWRKFDFRRGAPRIRRMNNFNLILRNIVFFLFPMPFLLSFAIEHGGDWTGYVAYTAVVALASAAVAAGWVASRRSR